MTVTAEDDGGRPGPVPHDGRRSADLSVELFDEVRASVALPDASTARMSRIRQLTLARPADSLGLLDETVHRVAAIRGAVPTGPLPAVVSVLAGDHGVAEQDVSLFRAGLTSTVLDLIQAGRAPVNIMAGTVPARVEAADFGLRRAVGDSRFRIASGTADISRTDAMPRLHVRLAIENGIAYTRERLSDAALVAVGEIGVGNTTATAAMAARLLGLPPTKVVGAGSGVDDDTVSRKREIVARALDRATAGPDDPEGLLGQLGGYEIAGNVGVILAAAAARQVIILDGYITGVAALLAVRICPAVAGYLVASHRSAEPGHAAVLHSLNLRPLLTLGMKLGMASGAALALPLVNTAIAVAASTPPARLVGLAEPR